MNKICTSIEQSNKLIELGIDVGSADMYYEPASGFNTEPSELKVGDIKYAHPLSVPAWSLSRLLDLMPRSIKRNEVGVHKTTYWLNIDFDDIYYTTCDKYKDDMLEWINEVDNTLTDNAFNMVCWLLKNKEIFYRYKYE